MVWIGRYLKDHLFPIPCHRQGHLKKRWKREKYKDERKQKIRKKKKKVKEKL